MTLADVLEDCERSAYERKMIHDVPDAPSVDRLKFLAERCRGKCVLDIGHTGPAAELIDSVAERVISVNKKPPADIVVELDAYPQTMWWSAEPVGSAHLIVCGEVLEHLANPGRLLAALRSLLKPTVITAPNAFGRAQAQCIKKRQEMVNIDHVAWYSYRTLKTLVERYGFMVSEWYWYNGPPLVAEGLIFVLE